jgi:flagellar biosynthetic protein FliQ
MNQNQILEVAREMILVTIQVGGPVMLIGLVVGVAISLLQALTQIQEMTLSFVPKVLAISAGLLLFLPFMLSTLVSFTQSLADRIIAGG